MPNWCLNEIRASEKVLSAIYDKEKGQATFQNVIPMPESLMVTAGGPQSTAIIYALVKMNKTLRDETLEKLKNNRFDYYKEIKQYLGNDEQSKENLQKLYKYNKEYKPDIEEQNLGIKHLKELGNTYISNIINYGYPDWYGWRNDHWGTKWDACDSYGSPEEGYMSFDTAWCPPEGIVAKLFEMFPNEDIDWYYEEPGMDFAGNYTPDYEGGFVDTPCPVPNYDDEMEEEAE